MAAAAAAFSSSRAVAGVTTTKGLFLIFSLLCLVCFASSLMDKNQLEKLKEMRQKIQEERELLKAMDKSEMVSASMRTSVLLSTIDQMTASLHFQPMDINLKDCKSMLEKTQRFLDRKYENLDTKIKDSEEELRIIDKLIKFLEENQAKL